MLQLLKEPLVDLGKFVNLVYSIAFMHSLGDYEHTLVCRLAKSSIDILNLKFLILNKAVHALTNHAKTLLNGLLKIAANGHNLTY